MDPSREVIEPRPEAMPLEFDALTEEQRSAGKNATRLLRGMTQQSWKPAPRQSPAHSYLPVIYKDAHHNRVILLDGERGSGKSALLVTLLDAYGRALTEQRLPPKYDAWITPADRIIPVGLIDLQPLPASTHLLFHLVASLERVVEAMETRREHSKQATAAWHPEEGNESRSRQTWRRFARVAASGWEDNLEARKGKLDPEAFAVEVEQGEIQRLDVTQTFREFMDALVDDYQAWSHWQSSPPPLFLLAIDDADMNPELSVHLLELVRKLWHPRLAFLLTGDTELFIDRLTAPPPAPARPGVIPLRPTAGLDSTRRRQLGMDRYAKVIPLQHRCRLEELKPHQRLEKGPGVKDILRSIRVPVKKLPPGRPSGSLLDYFEQERQILEALPGRLRPLTDLAEWLQLVTSGLEGPDVLRASAEAVAHIWQFVLRMEPGSSRLESMVRVDGTTGLLRIENGFVITWELETRAEAVTPHAYLSFERPIRAKAAFQGEPENGLGAEATAALLLAVTLIAETEARRGGAPLIPGGIATPLLAHATFNWTVTGGPLSNPWPLPDWDSFLDIALLRKDWELALVFATPPDPHVAERMAKAFLRIVLDVGLGKRLEADKTEQEDPLSWEALASALKRATLLKEGEHSQRQRALAQWALGRAGLLATPESGLPADVANALLDALRAFFKGSSWQNARQALRSARRERIALSFQREQNRAVDSNTVETVIQALDQQFPAYQFQQWVEGMERAPGRELVFSHLNNVLNSIRLPFLDNFIGTTGGTLPNYLTNLRLKWLKNAPTSMLQHIRNELDPFTRFSDAGALALMRFWKAACEAAEAPALVGALQLTQDRLTIATPYKASLEQKTKQPTAEREDMVFVPRETLLLSVHRVEGASTPFLESTSSSSAANHALEAVLRMAYDHEKDRSGTATSAEFPLGWRGILVHFNEQSFHPWPVPPWSTLFEWESLEQSWSEAVHLAEEAIEAGNVPPDIRIIDAMAYWMLWVCQDMQGRRSSHLGLRLQPSASDWASLILGQWKPQDPEGREFRSALYQEWRKRLVLMAAPESGLSINAASSILAGIYRSEVARPERNAITLSASGRRKARMVEAGMPLEQVDSFLSSIDKANPDHPWVKKFGVWKSTEDVPSL